MSPFQVIEKDGALPPSWTSKGEHWSIVDHICGGCWTGRLVRRKVDGAWLYRCTNCGMLGEGESRGNPTICACNSKIGDGKHGTGRLAGVRCMPNPDLGLERPAEIVVGVVAG